MGKLGFVAALYIGTLSTTMLGGFALVEQWPWWQGARDGTMLLDGQVPDVVRRNPQYRWHDLNVVYRTAQGDVHVAGKGIPNEMIPRLEDGGVPVRFLAADPRRARFDGDPGPVVWIWFVLAVALGATARYATRLLKSEAGYPE